MNHFHKLIVVSIFKTDLIESKKRQKMADRINAFNAKYQRTIQQTQNDLKQQQLNDVLITSKVRIRISIQNF